MTTDRMYLVPEEVLFKLVSAAHEDEALKKGGVVDTWSGYTPSVRQHRFDMVDKYGEDFESFYRYYWLGDRKDELPSIALIALYDFINNYMPCYRYKGETNENR